MYTIAIRKGGKPIVDLSKLDEGTGGLKGDYVKSLYREMLNGEYRQFSDIARVNPSIHFIAGRNGGYKD